MLKYMLPLVPGLLSFGPAGIACCENRYARMVSGLMLAFGLVILFVKVMDLEKKLKALETK
jgi:hypothetical protein